MEVKVKHTHGKEKALELAHNYMNKLKEEHGEMVGNLHEEWNGDNGDYSCTYGGMKLSGHIEVKDDEVIVSGKLPFVALPFSSAIENVIKENMNKVLNGKS